MKRTNRSQTTRGKEREKVKEREERMRQVEAKAEVNSSFGRLWGQRICHSDKD